MTASREEIPEQDPDRMGTYPLASVIASSENIPGDLDSEYFREDKSVKFWRGNAGGPPTREELQKIAQGIESPVEAAYWMYSLGRAAFFTLVGAQGFRSFFSDIIADAQKHNIAEAKADAPPDVPLARILGSLVGESIRTYRQELEYIKADKFKMPYDMEPRHRQFDPRFIFQSMAGGANEQESIIERRAEYRATDGKMDTKHWIASNLYPEYYKYTFHFQTDGWMSSDSAETYEYSTETIFGGRQDAMQRTSLVPFSAFWETHKARNPKVLELAAGTGRFATFLRDSYPEVDLTLLELSPYYIEKARQNLNYWERFRRGARDDAKPKPKKTRFMQAAAEDIPVDDASLDCIMTNYLFHELPPEARRAVFKEVKRVLKPGGTFILTDSVQIGDRDARLNPILEMFEKFDEPWYPSYLRENFGKIATEEVGGFAAGEKYLNSYTKTLTFTRL